MKAAGLHPAERAVCVNCAAYVSYNRMQVYNRDPFRSHELRCDCIILLDDGIAAVPEDAMTSLTGQHACDVKLTRARIERISNNHGAANAHIQHDGWCG